MSYYFWCSEIMSLFPKKCHNIPTKSSCDINYEIFVKNKHSFSGIFCLFISLFLFWNTCSLWNMFLMYRKWLIFWFGSRLGQSKLPFFAMMRFGFAARNFFSRLLTRAHALILGWNVVIPGNVGFISGTEFIKWWRHPLRLSGSVPVTYL